MPIGRVVRTIGGFYYVESLEKANEKGMQEPFECSIRGKLKLGKEGILVGDKVDYATIDGHTVILNILPRESELRRPYIANVDLIVLVFAHRNPDPNDYLIAKFLVLAETSGVPYLIVFNKTDLVEKRESSKLLNIYRSYGYRVLCTSVVTHLGKHNLQQALKDKVSVFAGPSGVGKSALVNMIAPGFKLQTGEVSEKIGRGKHTTREVQLLKIKPSCFIADTPGFSQIALDFLQPRELANCFPDFAEFRDSCKFKTCLHQSEPGCGIKTAVAEGRISSGRYQSYIDLLNELKTAWDKKYH